MPCIYRPSFRLVCSLVACLVLVSPLRAGAATVLEYRFDDGAGGATLLNPGLVIQDPNLSGVSAWSDADATLVANGLNGLGALPGRALAARSWHDGNSFLFSFDVASGYRLDLSGYRFDEQGSSGAQGLGPTSWMLSINAAPVANGTASRGNPGVNHAADLALNGLTGSVTLALFATGAEQTPGNPTDNSANATWRVDNFTLLGSVTTVPLPPALALLVAPLFGVLTVRRRGGNPQPLPAQAKPIRKGDGA